MSSDDLDIFNEDTQGDDTGFTEIYEERRKQQALEQQQETHKQQIDDENQNRQLRLQFAHRVFWLTTATLLVITGLLIASGVCAYWGHKFLSDSILISLLTFGGIDMLGLFSIILAYLFNKKSVT